MTANLYITHELPSFWIHITWSERVENRHSCFQNDHTYHVFQMVWKWNCTDSSRSWTRRVINRIQVLLKWTSLADDEESHDSCVLQSIVENVSSSEFTFTFIVTIIFSVFLPGRSRVVQKLKEWVCTSCLKNWNNNCHNNCKRKFRRRHVLRL
jgi:hypothetical protein